ncbi:hypothetical protein FISHEDRAFT_76753 [Fistulina hepatica ATCC 64428]|uniref:Uncharacterized protein n=1 Tax=Fistulina hepatica ATCC 64428 TaxID=1128425 RepID=A0A0D7A5R7_9AGAR|nr:hypothetical protein FISHEDRAFT_76753 [Fistulina hepatica ATCC 64428]
MDPSSPTDLADYYNFVGDASAIPSTLTDVNVAAASALTPFALTALPTQELPSWMSYTTYTGVSTTYVTIVTLPLTYYGPSIPLDSAWIWGGLSSPLSTSTASQTTSTTATLSSDSTSVSFSSSSTSSASSTVISSSSTITSISALATSSSVSVASSTASHTKTPTSGLSGGDIAGIVVGSVVVFILLILLLLVLLWLYRRRQRSQAAIEDDGEDADGGIMREIGATGSVGSYMLVDPFDRDDAVSAGPVRYIDAGSGHHPQDGEGTTVVGPGNQDAAEARFPAGTSSSPSSPGDGSPRISGEENDPFLQASSKITVPPELKRGPILSHDERMRIDRELESKRQVATVPSPQAPVTEFAALSPPPARAIQWRKFSVKSSRSRRSGKSQHSAASEHSGNSTSLEDANEATILQAEHVRMESRRASWREFVAGLGRVFGVGLGSPAGTYVNRYGTTAYRPRSVSGPAGAMREKSPIAPQAAKRTSWALKPKDFKEPHAFVNEQSGEPTSPSLPVALTDVPYALKPAVQPPQISQKSRQPSGSSSARTDALDEPVPRTLSPFASTASRNTAATSVPPKDVAATDNPDFPTEITIDILQEEPPMPADTWKSLSGSGPTNKRTTFGKPKVLEAPDYASETGSFHSMLSQRTPISNRSVSSNRSHLSVSARSTRVTASASSNGSGSRRTASSNRSGSISSARHEGYTTAPHDYNSSQGYKTASQGYNSSQNDSSLGYNTSSQGYNTSHVTSENYSVSSMGIVRKGPEGQASSPMSTFGQRQDGAPHLSPPSSPLRLSTLPEGDMAPISPHDA